MQQMEATVDGYAATCAETYAAVCAALWSERDLLEARAAEDLPLSEVLRAIAVDELASAVGLPRTATLAELAAAAPEPWRTMLAEHRVALRSLAARMGDGDEQRSLAEFLA